MTTSLSEITQLSRTSCQKTRGRILAAAGIAASAGFRLEIVERPPHAEGFYVVPRCWVIERAFGWFGRNRQLAKDFERLIETSTAMVVVAIIQIFARRMANA